MVAGSDATTQIRWYPALPGARALPFFTAFGAPVWDGGLPPAEGVGPAGGPQPWRPKRYPAPPGRSWIGTPDQYLHGLSAPPAEADLRGCCGPLIAPAGGPSLSGTSIPTSIAVTSAACACFSAADSTPGAVYVRSRGCACMYIEDTYYLSIYNVSYACACCHPYSSTPYDSWRSSHACNCTHVYNTVTLAVAVDSAACLCAQPADGVPARPTIRVTSAACLCAMPADGVPSAAYQRSHACVCAAPADGVRVGVGAASAACLCAAPADAVTTPTPDYQPWQTGWQNPVVQDPEYGPVALSLLPVAGEHWQATMPDGTIWACSALTGSPAPAGVYYLVLSFTASEVSYSLTFEVYDGSTYTGQWLAPATAGRIGGDKIALTASP